jgi:hypothetical protein
MTAGAALSGLHPNRLRFPNPGAVDRHASEGAIDVHRLAPSRVDVNLNPGSSIEAPLEYVA